jgi:hypothetical protein
VNAPRSLIRRFTQRYSRRPLPRPNLAYYLWQYAGNGWRTWRRRTTPALDERSAVIAGELAREGITTGPSEQFLTAAGRSALDEAARDILETSRSPRIQAVAASGASDTGKKDFVVYLVKYPHGIPADSPLLKVALDPQLLDIVSLYLGFWPCLYAISAWLNFPTATPPAKSQLWHRDPEDLRLVKVFIYLADVDEDCGPFTYVPGTHPFSPSAPHVARGRKLKDARRTEDERMERVFDRSEWRVCAGPARTMILADTLGFHRGGRPTSGQRVLATFTYTSRTPVVEHKLWVTGMPAWATAPIQRAALELLLDGPDRSQS